MTTASFDLLRRSCLASVFALALPAAQAQAQNALTAVGVFALLGDSIQVSAASEPTSDTRIERISREALEVANIGFDSIALKVVRSALLARVPAPRIELFRATTPIPPDEQRAIAVGASRGELPGWIVQTIEAKQLTHVLLLTRLRADANIRTGDNTSIGRGTLEGIGFYLDTLYTIQNTATGALSTGLIAPHVYMRLTLLDTQTAAIVRSYDVRDGRAWGARDVQVTADPWTFMTAAQKVTVLREMVEQATTRGMAQVLLPP